MRFLLAAAAALAMTPLAASAAIDISSSSSGIPAGISCDSNDTVRFYGNFTYYIGTTHRATTQSVLFTRRNGNTENVRLDIYTAGNKVSIPATNHNGLANPGWTHLSRITPGAGEYYLLSNNNKTGTHLNIANITLADAGHPVALLVNTYEYTTYRDGGTTGPASTWSTAVRDSHGYLQTPASVQTNAFSYDPSSFDRKQQRSCIAIYPSWCGDNVTDNGSNDTSNEGEQCDLGAANGTPGAACSATCQAITGPVCGAADGKHTYGGAPSLPADLCSAGTLTGSVTGIGTAANPWTWNCSLNGVTTAPSCTADSSALAACVAGTVTGGPQAAAITAGTPGLCPAAQTVTANSFVALTAGTRTDYTWACTNGGTSTATDGQNGGNCSAWRDTAPPPCTVNCGGGGGSSGVCGAASTKSGQPLAAELCANGDAGTVTSAGGKWSWTCNGTSQIANCSTTGGGGGSVDTDEPVDDGGDTSYDPDSGLRYTVFGRVGTRAIKPTQEGGTINNPYYGVIIGKDVPLFEKQVEAPCVKNEGSAEADVGNFCVSIVDSSALKNVSGQACKNVGTLAPNQEACIGYSMISNITGNTNFNDPYKDTSLMLSIRDGQLPKYVKFRVAKPAIGGINGGNAFVGAPIGYNVNKLTENFFTGNPLQKGNFLVTTVNDPSKITSDHNLSSLTKNLTPEESGKNAEAVAGQKQAEAAQIATASRRSSFPGGDCATHDNPDVQTPACSFATTYRNCNVVDRPMSRLDGVRTVLVEHGDLSFNKDTAYGASASGASWAWVAQDGNVVISKDVNRIAGVVMALCADLNSLKARQGECGKIVASGGSTANQLVVDGALYGDASDLVQNRTYIRGTDPASPNAGTLALTVGTVIKYSNRALKCAPPLLEKFIERYAVTKVAR